MEPDRIALVEDAVEEEQNVPPEIYLPPTINEKNAKAIVLQGQPVSVHDNIVRIQTDGDPMGQLLAMMNGKLMPSYVVQKDGSVKTIYETATLAQRISIAKWLGDRVMPKVSVNVKKDMDSDWEADLRNAAAQAD